MDFVAYIIIGVFIVIPVIAIIINVVKVITYTESIETDVIDYHEYYHRDSDGHRHTDRYISVCYCIDGEMYDKEIQVGKRVKAGSHVVIHYLPSNPDKVMYRPYMIHSIGSFVFFLVLVFVFLGILVYVQLHSTH